MRLSSSAGGIALCCWCGLLLGIPSTLSGQTNYFAPHGTEYAIVGKLPGDQVRPDVALTAGGGYAVWEDNITDGSGWGISAQRLDGTLSGALSPFRVNVQGTNHQENPRVALLKDGGAAIVWQGGKAGGQHIYARFLAANGTWLTTNDVSVSASGTNFITYTTNVTQTIVTNGRGGRLTYVTNKTTTIITNSSGGSASYQIDPVLTVLNNSNVVVVWGSYNQAGPSSLLDVYGQILSPTGQKIGSNFLINQFTAYNQQAPAVAALKSGGFVVTWISEQERAPAPVFSTASDYFTAPAAPVPSVDVYARLYNSGGVASGGAFLVNTDSSPCANPVVAGAADGGFMVAWCARDRVNLDNSLDIFARSFSSAGAGGTVVRVNAHLYGDQYQPRIGGLAGEYLIVWTSLAQDGSREGVFGQFVHKDGTLVGAEFDVTTTTINMQIHPAVAADGAGQFLVVWASYGGAASSFDLFAQRYLDVASILQPMSAPFVCAPFDLSGGVYQPQLQVSWSPLLGIAVSNYEVYVDGAATPMALVSSNTWTMTAANGLAASSTHSFRLDYVTDDGRRAPLSPAASGTTWSGLNWGGIPNEWMQQFYGNNTLSWPLPAADSDGDGMTTWQEFLSGTIPTNSTSALRIQIGQSVPTPNVAQSPQGLYVSWNTQPGFTYQVQVTTDFVSWSNVGAPRFAAGNSDSIFVGGSLAGYYRVLLLRQ